MGITIMVAEDDRNISQVVSEYLKNAKFGVIPVLDGFRAAEIIETNNAIDLFIFDIMLPGVSGLKLLSLAREYHTDVPIMMLTALSDEPTQLTSFDRKADDYVTKPFSPRVLVKRVEALLHRCGKLQTMLSFGDISIDLDNYEAFENDNKVALTLKEFELLRVLINSRNRVLSRQQLLDLVWGQDYFGDERTVDAHIKNLRKKFTHEIIRTVKGVGYKLLEED